MKKKNKRNIFLPKHRLRLYRHPIYIAIGLIIFPIVVGLFYKIPINLVNIEIGDLLSFYAVALGLFATYLTYIDNENKKEYEQQEKLKPKITLFLEVDTNNNTATIQLNNQTDNDYTVNYVGCEIYENEDRRYLNAKNQLDINFKYSDDPPVELIQIGIIDHDRHDWMVGFEKQSNSDVYCRTFIDLIT